MAASLYICYFGLREPLVRTQVIPYLRELSDAGHKISFVTFEPEKKTKWTREQIAAERADLASVGIDWHCLAYHKRPSAIATAYDVFVGSMFVRRFIKREQIDILHGRVHVPMLMAALARRSSGRRPKLLFDIRGFFPEEYVDAGVWPENGWLYRTTKRIEKWLMSEADGFVVLTEKAREILFTEPSVLRGRPAEVIPCCVDSGRFENTLSRDEARCRLGVEDRFVIAYVGSFGGWYLTDEMMDLFAAAREFDPTTFVLVLTQRDPEKIGELLLARGFAKTDILVTTVEPERLADYLVAGDVAVSFIKACYSKLSSSPTKIAEYLACGLPIIANRGVGDLDSLIEGNGVGVLIDGFDTTSYKKVLTIDADALREKCKAVAAREFDLSSVAGERYRRLYQRMLS